MKQRRIESFLVRIVVEEAGCEPDEWRGRVQHVGSGIEAQFETLPELLALVRSQIFTDVGPDSHPITTTLVAH